VPDDDRAQDVRTLDLSQDTLPAECALGVVWCVESDSFSFRTVNQNKPFTRRGILSVVSSVYDPLGLLCPFVLSAKLLVQELCKRKYGWDDELPAEAVTHWKQWLDDLPKVEQLKVRRCVKPPDVSHVKAYSLHHFCDASQIGYGVASYVRMEFEDERPHCSLILGKSRLAPVKMTTIPRLELMAAVLAVKIDKMLRSELDYEIQQSVFWTDSTIVLHYIANQDKRFHTFVANRVSLIHDGSEPSQWKHVPSELNPADDASRGLRMDELLSNGRWFSGPKFIWNKADRWPTLPVVTADTEDLEPKKEAKAYTTDIQESTETVVQRLFARHSSWYALKKSVAWLLRAKAFLKNRVHKKEATLFSGLAPLSVGEIQQAERAIVLYVQQHAFENEFRLLKKCSDDEPLRVSRHSNLRKLEPILSADGVLCKVKVKVNVDLYSASS